MSKFFKKKFRRNVAVKLEVFRLVHHTHPAAAQLLDDAIVRNGLADHGKKRPPKPECGWMLVGTVRQVNEEALGESHLFFR